MYGEWRYSSTDLNLDFKRGETAPCNQWTGGSVGTMFDPDVVQYRQICCLSRESNLDSWVVQFVD
jgi:hypothetical protein